MCLMTVILFLVSIFVIDHQLRGQPDFLPLLQTAATYVKAKAVSSEGHDQETIDVKYFESYV